MHTPNDSPSAPALATLDHWSARAYEELSGVARRAASPPTGAPGTGATPMTTEALVHETYLRLTRHAAPADARRAQLLGISARVMRRVLVEYAAEQGTSQELRAPHPITDRFTHRALAPTFDDDAAQIGRLERALRALEAIDARLAPVAELRYFGGLTDAEVAEVLGIATRQAQRDWLRARAVLFDLLREAD